MGGRHVMCINKELQAGAKVKPGDTAHFVMQRDDQPRTVAVPLKIKKVLAANRDARAIFDQFVQEVTRTHPSAGYLYQVVQGVCLTLECPDVRALLLPWIDQYQGESGGG